MKTRKTTNGNTRRSCIRGSKEWMIPQSILYNIKNARKKYHERGHLAVCIITPEYQITQRIKQNKT
jgi:hypothetical protein